MLQIKKVMITNLNLAVMKKMLLIFISGIFAGFISGFGQGIPVYPIPSYEVPVNGYANFQEKGARMSTANPQGKRDINVMVTTSYPGHNKCEATVWFYSLASVELMGPFTATEDELLTEEIDFKAWGAFVESDEDILVSVWIGGSSQPPSYKRNSMTKVRFH